MVESDVEDVNDLEEGSSTSSDISDWTMEAGISFVSLGRRKTKRLRKYETFQSVSKNGGVFSLHIIVVGRGFAFDMTNVGEPCMTENSLVSD